MKLELLKALLLQMICAIFGKAEYEVTAHFRPGEAQPFKWEVFELKYNKNNQPIAPKKIGTIREVVDTSQPWWKLLEQVKDRVTEAIRKQYEGTRDPMPEKIGLFMTITQADAGTPPPANPEKPKQRPATPATAPEPPAAPPAQEAKEEPETPEIEE